MEARFRRVAAICGVISESHGSPAQLGTHFFPDTNGLEDADSGVDDRDYNVTWKLSVGLFDCVLNGTYCTYGLGHGSFDQMNMSNWSDGTPVNSLMLLIPDRPEPDSRSKYADGADPHDGLNTDGCGEHARY